MTWPQLHSQGHIYPASRDPSFPSKTRKVNNQGHNSLGKQPINPSTLNQNPAGSSAWVADEWVHFSIRLLLLLLLSLIFSSGFPSLRHCKVTRWGCVYACVCVDERAGGWARGRDWHPPPSTLQHFLAGMVCVELSWVALRWRGEDGEAWCCLRPSKVPRCQGGAKVPLGIGSCTGNLQ